MMTEYHSIFEDPKNGTPREISQAGCVALARLGKEAWNQWRGSFPNAHLENHADFSGHDFIEDPIDFSGFFFGNCASFEDAKFGDHASFEGADFGNCANFSGAKFGNWADFSGAKFDAYANFSNAKFGACANFLGSKFGAYSIEIPFSD